MNKYLFIFIIICYNYYLLLLRGSFVLSPATFFLYVYVYYYYYYYILFLINYFGVSFVV